VVGGGFVESVEEVAIGVEGHLDRRVSQTGLDDLRVLALGNEKRSVRVPEIVEAKRFAD
jgi:hypothetical protein